MTHTHHYSYAVIEDIEEVREAIVARVDRFNNWNCVCTTGHYHIASENIRQFKPLLLFLDYSILGGNAFMLLDEIEMMPDYDPYIVFFTAYMSDQPEIAERLLNRYPTSINFFLNKPIFVKLDEQLDRILSEAVLFSKKEAKNAVLWIKTVQNKSIPVVPQLIICFSQAVNPRNKIIHLSNGIQHEFKATWSQCEQITNDFKLNFEYANTRLYLVNIEKITSIKRPNIWLNNDLKVVVTKERWVSFIQRMESSNS